jgi:hypothetical protein
MMVIILLLAATAGAVEVVSHPATGRPMMLTVQVIELPAALDLVTVLLQTNHLTFHWRSVPSAVSYVLECDEDLDFASPVTVATTSDTTAVDSVNVAGNERMFYRVRVE